MKVLTQTELRLEDLERRVAALETKNRSGGRGTFAEYLIETYGECVDKTAAARILGVTRATIYAMLADGRLSGSCEGRRVDVRSIARYLNARTKEERA